jgi:hypothetical protein
VANVLAMAALELRDPMFIGILVKADDAAGKAVHRALPRRGSAAGSPKTRPSAGTDCWSRLGLDIGIQQSTDHSLVLAGMLCGFGLEEIEISGNYAMGIRKGVTGHTDSHTIIWRF